MGTWVHMVSIVTSVTMDIPVVTVLCSVAIDHLKAAIISLKRKVDLQDMGTRLNNLDNTYNVNV